MHVFSFLAAFLLLRHLRKYVLGTPLATKWVALLNKGSLVTVGVFLFATLLFNDKVADVLGCIYLLAILIYLRKEPDFTPTHQVVKGFYPFISVIGVTLLVQLFAKSFYLEWNDYFGMALVGAIIYAITIWSTYKKGVKELELEREKRITEEKEKKFISIKKTELEIIVASRTAELMLQKDELQKAIKELQATQAQLIQQEKLASLGELTAGIAHEIQNPLNFVNNFSEVSIELLDELKSGLMQSLPKAEQEHATEILNDLTHNLEKITYHGKRADSIVKGMLQHSRASNGQKEPTDINALADEYLRLSYHGLRAKDKSFNATLQTDYDSSLCKVSVVPQDIGRVFLNMFNNAFYSVALKKKSLNGTYEPVVQVCTSKKGDRLEIIVKDNGVGVPKEVVDKIYQPFFTTKPSGEGTGLGLSLSYDIITKGHHGEMKVISEEGQFAEFVISIPLTN
ncbi:sensor histidine kinase [Rufibacter tibetensis]|uniref:histidine kinase n=1 Tax=Rufibacter tibetensis TaxID=512763 RepID=A0A0P0CF82_9BACT|nr:ATP-binding protein [Rufibacter tibetensis]ALJ00530.1 histidine kinase [Rufibacter tibetensis]